MTVNKSICCYCGTGCGVLIEHEDNRITDVRGDPDHPANFGRLCTKGSTLHLTATRQTAALRATRPELRLDKQSPRIPVGWGEALDHAATRFAEVINTHGPDAVAFYISGQLLTEDYYVFNKLAKGLIGTNNIDTNSRLCMSSAVSGYKATLGADAPPCAYDDIDATDCLFITGSNTAYAHPIVFRRIEDARKNRPQMKLIVVDPRRTDTAEAADLYLPIVPGSDVALYNAMLHVMLWDGLCDTDFIRDHTEGFEALRDAVRDMTPEAAAAICGLGKDGAKDIVTAARWFGESGKATLSMWCQGLNQSSQGTHKNAALIQLHLATGKIGKPGSGPFSLTGQPNAMGGREVGGMANQLSAHRDLSNAQHRAEVATLWGLDEVPATPGLTAVDLFDAVERGEIKALWIACTNPAQSMPNANKVCAALAKCDFVVVQEAYVHTDTTTYADLLLPAASWGEKEGSITNSERTVTHVTAAIAPPGEALPDWRAASDFAQVLGNKLGRADLAKKLFPYQSAEEIFNEHRESTRGRDLDITGLSYAILDRDGPQQWPYPTGATQGKKRLYTDGIFPTPSGRAHFIVTQVAATAEVPDARYPFRLNTGRLRDQWHGMSRTGTVPRLFSHVAEPEVELNPQDCERRGFVHGELVRIKNKRGSFVARVAATSSIRAGQAFMPMHWGGQFMRGAGANAVTIAAVDPISKQPELKNSAVAITKFTARWQIVAMRRAPASAGELVFALHASMQPWLARCGHASLTLAGREDPLLIFRGWIEDGSEPWSSELLNAFDKEFGLDNPQTALSFVDAKRNISKRAVIEGGTLSAVRLAGETRAADWLRDLMIRGTDVHPSTTDLRRWLLAPVAQPPAGSKSRGRIICNCLDVSEDEILADLNAGLDLPALQEKRKCGTSCGSCLPELKRLSATARRAA